MNTLASRLVPALSNVMVLLALLGSAAAQSAPQTYVYTGGPQIYVVPPGIASITVDVKGAQGNSPSGGGTGGLGGVVSATISVTPGETLQVMVGGSTGYNGGGDGAASPGGGMGGGASDIRRPTFSTSSSCAFTLNCGLGDRIVVAGGGGGGGSTTMLGSANGGAGGNTATNGIAANTGSGDAVGGGAGSLASGGSLGTGTLAQQGKAASAGGSGSGGAAAQAWIGGGVSGGGGGGYYGGGGGGISDVGGVSNAFTGIAGGGGGTSWASGAGVAGATFSDASNSNGGSITINTSSAITNATRNFTGAPETYTVPIGVTKLAVRLHGGGSYGSGDVVYGQLPVTGGQQFQISIGGSGLAYVQTGPTTGVGGTGGYNGGGNAGTYANAGVGSGGGGGASDIRVSPFALEDRVVVAGGGGGAYGFFVQFGWGAGTGGGIANGGGGDSIRGGGEPVYGGGTLTAGGKIYSSSGVLNNTYAANSTVLGGWLSGGSASASGDCNNCGGGGGGYYGGAAGAGGGGGSSYASVTGPDATKQGVGNVLGVTGALFSHSQGGNVGDGMALVVAMPDGVTGTAQYIVTSGLTSGVTIPGSVNPRYLATSPIVLYSTVQATVDALGGTSVPMTATVGGATVLAGTGVQAVVTGSITGLAAGTYYYRVCAQSVAGTGCGATLSFVIGVTPPPTVTAIGPTNGSTAGGTAVTITGTNLTGATAVTIGGVACTAVTVVSATSITCTSPAGTAGTASVLVTTPNGTNVANSLFTYAVPPVAPPVTPPVATPPLLPPLLNPVPGLTNAPTILSLSGGTCTTIANDLAGTTSNTAATPLEYASQSTSGSVVLSGYRGNNLTFTPIEFPNNAATSNVFVPRDNGQYQVQFNCMPITVIPSVQNLGQLVGLLPFGSVISMANNGVLSAKINGVTYVIQPGEQVQLLNNPTGQPSLTTSADGVMRFMDAAGNTQILFPGVLEPDALRRIVVGLDSAATVRIQLNGTAAIRYLGKDWVLVPDMILGGVPAGREGDYWWQEGPNRFKVRMQNWFDNQTQGFTLR